MDKSIKAREKKTQMDKGIRPKKKDQMHKGIKAKETRPNGQRYKGQRKKTKRSKV